MVPGTQWIVNWMETRASLDAVLHIQIKSSKAASFSHPVSYMKMAKRKDVPPGETTPGNLLTLLL
jgi:hypothetical protein